MDYFQTIVPLFLKKDLQQDVLSYINIERMGFIQSKQMIFYGTEINFPAIIGKASLFVTLFTALTGLLYLIENRQFIKHMAWRFYRVFIPSDL